MKKILFAAVSALAFVGVAVAADSTQFGVLKVPSTAKKTIVGVPWFESGTGNNDVTVSNLVLTAGLNDGDELRLYENSTCTKSWQLNGGKWVGATMQSDQGSSQSGNDQTTIARGKAIMLVRANPGSCFYIMGKPASSEAGSTDLLSGKDDNPAYSLIAPSRTTATSVGDLTFSGLVSMKEYLIVRGDSGNVTLTYVNGSGWYNPKTKTYNDISIPAGEGVWFMSRASGTKSVSWGN